MRVFTVNIEFPYMSDQVARKAERERILQGLEDIGVDIKHIKSVVPEWNQDFMLTETQLVDVTIWGDVKFKIKMHADVGVGNAALVNRISAITARLDEVSSSSLWGDNNHYNEKCNQHQPGNMLSHYNETLLLDDCCTDYLQDALDKGWRIIVACPQPDGRRADYVLGRYNSGHVPGKGALRSHS